MNKSESIAKIAAALVKAQRNIEAASKSAPNPFFKSKYANLNSVMEACKGALNEQGITVLQPVNSTPEGDVVETMLLHESGEFLTSGMKLILSKNDMQAYGSAVSYARRYGLQSMVFIGAEDDDGEAAVGRKHETSAQSKPVSSPSASATSGATKPVNFVAAQPATKVEVSKATVVATSQTAAVKAKTGW